VPFAHQLQEDRERARQATARAGVPAPRALQLRGGAAALRAARVALAALPRLLSRAPNEARAHHLRTVRRALLPPPPPPPPQAAQETALTT
jgi:hypothetical protein